MPFETRANPFNGNINFDAVQAINSFQSRDDEILLFDIISRFSDFSRVNDTVFASFTEQGVSEVPLPAAAWMFLAGLGGLSAARRKKRAKNSKEL